MPARTGHIRGPRAGMRSLVQLQARNRFPSIKTPFADLWVSSEIAFERKLSIPFLVSYMRLVVSGDHDSNLCRVYLEKRLIAVIRRWY